MGMKDSLPNHFDFSGRVIFISNFKLKDVPQPIISRALYVDVSMTPEEKIERIRKIAPALCPTLGQTERTECIDLLDTLKYQAEDLNLRTMLNVAQIRKSNPTRWREMSKYMILANHQ
jgi:hypothetical protein